MSRSNDGLPMLPPWLSDSEVTQVGQQIDYEAPPVQNLPHDDLIEDTPAPKRGRFKRPAPESERSEAPGPRKEKRRKGWRRDKNDDQPVDERHEADESAAPAPRPGDQWSTQQPDQSADRWQSPPPPAQHPTPADYAPSDRSPDARPADPYQPGPAQQPYRPAPDNSWQQGPSRTGDRPPANLPTRTPSEPSAEFRPLGPRPPQPPPDRAPISTEATVHLGPRPDLPAPPPQAPVAPHPGPVTPQSPAPHQDRASAQPPLAPQLDHASAPQVPVAPPQDHASTPQVPLAPPQTPVPPPQDHGSAPQVPVAPPHTPQAHAPAPQAPVTRTQVPNTPQAPVSSQQAPVARPQTPVAPQQTPGTPPQQPNSERARAAEPVSPVGDDRSTRLPADSAPDARLDDPLSEQQPSEGAAAQGRSATESAASPERLPLPAPPTSGTRLPQADVQQGESASTAEEPRSTDREPVAGPTPTATEPPSWLDGPHRAADSGQAPPAKKQPSTESGQAATGGGQAPEPTVSEIAERSAETATPSKTTDSRAVDSASRSTTSDPTTGSDAPPSWLGATPHAPEPTAQQPIQRLPDLPPAPSESDVQAPAPTADPAPAFSANVAPPATPTTDSSPVAPAEESASVIAASDSPSVVPTEDSAASARTDDQQVGSNTGPATHPVSSSPPPEPPVSQPAPPDRISPATTAQAAHTDAAPTVHPVSSSPTPESPISQPEPPDRIGPAVAAARPDIHAAQTGPAEQLGGENRAPDGRFDAADSAASVTRGRHRLTSEGAPPPTSPENQAAVGAGVPPQPPEQQVRPPFAPVPPYNPTADRAQTGPSAHTSGFDHRIPQAPTTGPGPRQAPKQQRRTAQSGADAALRAALAAQPLRTFDGPAREPNPVQEQWQTGQPPADQQGRPLPPQAPQWQSPVAPGPDSPPLPGPGPHDQAGMRAPSDEMPGPHGFAQAPVQQPVPPHSTPSHGAPQHPSMPQHPVPPQHAGPPQQQWRGPADQGPPPEQWQGGQGQSPSLDNVPIRGRATKKAAGSGWRKAVHHVSGGAINPGMSAEERRLQELVARIRQPVRGDYRIAVLSLKGGVGKTTTTMGIGSTFASIRGDRVIAVDANPDFGTLSQRVPLQTRSTVRDLLLDSSIQRYSDVRRHTSQATSRLEVLASERDPAASEAFNEDEYRSVARILQRFYNIILTDCGTGLMHSAMAGVLELAHSLVLISSPAIDGARSAAATLDWLSLHGHDHLVRNAVVVINSPRAGSPNVGIQQLREYFLSRCRAVHIIPFDPHMSEGAEIDLHRLHKQTKRAYVELAATVADDFATDHRRYRG
ncbi:MinD/ParA family ATP-binding protein [Nocardia cyriacigeorgica]|uniref:MinD/ParA family ATP-binding protein n=1 Tax=Nocardia cyriacigeorgica TaxID=135487 RepID=UPI002455FDE3|nr:MinD/ParA family protein [Nocardia cyriacigeorgica]